VLGAQWDTTASANGAYEICNVVTDNAGHTATAIATVTVANGIAPPIVVDPLAPQPPTNLSLTRARFEERRRERHADAALGQADRLRPRKRARGASTWVTHRSGPPTAPKVYRGLGTSTKVTAPGQTGYLALYSYNKAGNYSQAARTKVSLASLIPLRPLTGSVLHTPPLLTWKSKQGSAYYNLQLYRNGKRVLVVWPSHASYRIPASALKPGTYVWYVWPALRSGGAAPAFASLIGRATFVYAA